jgi:hypothetical protein
MLPSKCPLCDIDLSIEEDSRPTRKGVISACCPNFDWSKNIYSHYSYLLKEDDVNERIIIGDYVICNFKNINKNTSHLFKKSTFFNENCTPRLIMKVDARIPPTVTEKKLQTYIVFS